MGQARDERTLLLPAHTEPGVASAQLASTLLFTGIASGCMLPFKEMPQDCSLLNFHQVSLSTTPLLCWFSYGLLKAQVGQRRSQTETQPLLLHLLFL